MMLESPSEESLHATACARRAETPTARTINERNTSRLMRLLSPVERDHVEKRHRRHLCTELDDEQAFERRVIGEATHLIHGGQDRGHGTRRRDPIDAICKTAGEEVAIRQL